MPLATFFVRQLPLLQAGRFIKSDNRFFGAWISKPSAQASSDWEKQGRASEKRKFERSWQDAAKCMFDESAIRQLAEADKELGLVRLPVSNNAPVFQQPGGFVLLWPFKVRSYLDKSKL